MTHWIPHTSPCSIAITFFVRFIKDIIVLSLPLSIFLVRLHHFFNVIFTFRQLIHNSIKTGVADIALIITQWSYWTSYAEYHTLTPNLITIFIPFIISHLTFVFHLPILPVSLFRFFIFILSTVKLSYLIVQYWSTWWDLNTVHWILYKDHFMLNITVWTPHIPYPIRISSFAWSIEDDLIPHWPPLPRLPSFVYRHLVFSISFPLLRQLGYHV